MPATFHVYTYKDGLLARVAHDLRLTVTRFRVELADGRVTARFEPGSARVDGVAHGERIDLAGLSDKDKRTIEATIRDEILGTGVVRFEGAAAGGEVRGTLTLAGRSAPLVVPVAARPGELVVDTTLTPSRWGVAPYKALAGAMRLQDRWRVRLVLPYSGEIATGAAVWEGADARLG